MWIVLPPSIREGDILRRLLPLLGNARQVFLDTHSKLMKVLHSTLVGMFANGPLLHMFFEVMISLAVLQY